MTDDNDDGFSKAFDGFGEDPASVTPPAISPGESSRNA